MKKELSWFVSLLGLGCTLVAYAHGTFMTKEVGGLLLSEIRDLRLEIKDVRSYLYRIQKSCP